MRSYLPLCLVVTLSGCAYSPYVERASEETVRAYRAANVDLTNFSEAWLCRGIAIREWLVRFGTPERAAAWRTLCEGKSLALPIGEAS